MTVIARIARFSLTSADPGRLARFYGDAFGFEPVARERQDALFYGVPGRAEVHRLRLGLQEIELVGFERAGAPYPAGSTSHDGWFQHLALVVSDMTAAHERLSRQDGWQTISRGGPVVLPQSSGGVTAFKFRDPEGHPLELLLFPPGGAPAAWSGRSAGSTPCLGIDHSAIVVADEGRSLAFYTGLGLAVSARSANHGAEQVRLDDAPEVAVGVVGLDPPAVPPHLELLAYRHPPVRPGSAGAADIACTRTVVIADPSEPARMLSDPDGHRVMLVDGSGSGWELRGRRRPGALPLDPMKGRALQTRFLKYRGSGAEAPAGPGQSPGLACWRKRTVHCGTVRACADACRSWVSSQDS